MRALFRCNARVPCDEDPGRLGPPCTSIALTLLGLAATTGRRTLRAVLDEHAVGTTLTRSELEERTLALCRRAQLPAPTVNADVGGASGRTYTVDFHWPAQRVVLETDGHAYHRTPRAIERDRRKEADLVTAGHQVLRSTWQAVEREPDRLARMLRVALAI